MTDSALPFPLAESTDPRWVGIVLESLDTFMLDHAACERKAAAMAMSFVTPTFNHYPQIIQAMIGLASEEWDHFRRVYGILRQRGKSLEPNRSDTYVKRLLQAIRNPESHYVLDKLLVFAVVEARGCERFGILSSALKDPVLAAFYSDLSGAEVGHSRMFLRLANHYFAPNEVEERLRFFLNLEAQTLRDLPMQPFLH